jgi:hypothetical protein
LHAKKRLDNAKRRTLLAADHKISNINEKLQKTYDSLCKARQAIVAKIRDNLANHDISAAIIRLTGYADKALQEHLKFVEEAKQLQNTGTGKVSVLEFDLVNP